MKSFLINLLLFPLRLARTIIWLIGLWPFCLLILACGWQDTKRAFRIMWTCPPDFLDFVAVLGFCMMVIASNFAVAGYCHAHGCPEHSDAYYTFLRSTWPFSMVWG